MQHYRSFIVWIFLLILPLSLFETKAPVEAPASLIGISTKSTNNVDLLVRDVLLKGDCFNVENINQIGSIRGIGFFEGGNSSIGIEQGIILATGDISNSHGPNIFNSMTTDFRDTLEDQFLKSLATDELFDNVGIEFDFIPQKEVVSFRYVFASEEYCEYVGSEFNDVFGFFVNGPGISGPFANGAINVALIPESDEFVAINNVNWKKNSNYYVKNELEVDAFFCGSGYAPNHHAEIEYDGFTTVLTATFEVIPCQTYHIRLVVGDVGDAQLDSAVFLEAESFDVGPKVDIRYVPNIVEAGKTMVEGCADGTILFERTDEIGFDRELVVDFVLNSSSTASEGADFPPLIKQIVIPAMEPSISIPISAFQDQQLEDTEKLVLDLDIPCYCQPKDNALLFIKDQDPLILIPDTLTTCPEESIILMPSVIAGSEPFQYQWQNGTEEDNLIVGNAQPGQTYQVTVTDICGEVANAEMEVDFFTAPKASLAGIYDWCPGQSLQIPVEFVGQGPFQLEYQIGEERFFVDSIMSTPYSLEVNRPGDLEITRFLDQNCEGTIEGGVTIQPVGPVVRSNVIPLLCPDAKDAIIELFIEHNRNYEIVWDTIVNDANRPSGLGPGRYRYNVIDEDGCRFSEEILILRPKLEEILRNGCSASQILDNLFIPTAFSPNNDGRNDEFRIYSNPDVVARVKAMRVFDRWGNLLFIQEDFIPTNKSIFWDGKHKGSLMSNGVYIYQIEIETFGGIIEQLSGSVTLMR